MVDTINITTGFIGGTISLPIDINPDNLVEGDHNFTVRIVDDGSFTIGDFSEIEVLIMDDDSECMRV